MKPVVFVGPTLDLQSARKMLGADYRPPARQGDVLRAVVGGAPAVGLIDGYFERVPSVWHKEILFAIAEGVSVYGSSSMGALRATELHSFGMVGIGRVFQSYRDGIIEDDDEVAVLHAPAEFGYAPLTEAMVNIRATIAAAIQVGVIEREFGAKLVSLAKLLYYKDRSYSRIVRDAERQGLCKGTLDRFENWVRTGKVDQKRLDALRLLQTMSKDQKKGFRARPMKEIFVEESLSWRRAREFIDALNRRDIPRWHFSMLTDAARTTAFEAAIKATIKSGDIVLDIGTGSGLLALMAARAGATRVYACEAVAVIAEKARQIISSNGFSDRIVVLNKRSTDLVVGVDLPERVDVLMSEIVDHALIGEGILPTLEHAVGKLAKPGVRVIPQSGRLLISAFECAGLHSRFHLSEAAGFDISPFNEFSPCGASTLLQLNGFNIAPLSSAVEAFSFRFSDPDFPAEQKCVPITCNRRGRLHGLAAWFELAVDRHNLVSNSPWRPDNHWSHEVYLLRYPRTIRLGDGVNIYIQHDRKRIQFSTDDQPSTPV